MGQSNPELFALFLMQLPLSLLSRYIQSTPVTLSTETVKIFQQQTLLLKQSRFYVFIGGFSDFALGGCRKFRGDVPKM
jgi:hypothetical protein